MFSLYLKMYVFIHVINSQMTQTVRSLTDEVLAKLGTTSLTEVVSTLPSALTTGLLRSEGTILT